MAINNREFIVSIVHNGLVIVFFTVQPVVNRYKRINYLDKRPKKAVFKGRFNGYLQQAQVEEELRRAINMHKGTALSFPWSCLT